MTSVRLFGLAACDTCRKARKALEAAGYSVAFQDVRENPPTREMLLAWGYAFGEDIVNRRSTTWRGLTEAERNLPVPDLLLAYPAAMKRPVIIADEAQYLGWAGTVQKALSVA